MGDITFVGEDDIAVHIKRSERARRLSLRVSSVDGRVTLTLPRSVSQKAAQEFVQQKADWIGNAVANCHAAVPIVIGSTLPIEGRMREISAGTGRAAKLIDDQVLAPEGREGPTIEALVKYMARDRLSVAVQRFAEGLGETAGRLTLRDTRSRWGSCTSEGNLMFSWRLLLAPPEVLEYVAAHEVAHLRHMDHSARFWGAVGDLYPGYETPRAWLRREGAGLHRYRFRMAD